MKSTVFLMLSAFILTLVCAGVCPPVAADIWTSGKVVYTTNAYGDLDIVVMGPNGEHVEDLTFSTDDEFDPTWSPDGTEILYVRHTNLGNEVWLMNADGSNQRHIVVYGEHPSWAPDGDRFVARNHDDEHLAIFTLNEERDDWSDVEVIVVSGNPAYPAYSPDGNYIAYVAGGTSDNPHVGGSLYVYDVAADRSTKIVSGSPGYSMSYPTWGPQSNQIVFAWENAGWGDGAPGIFTVRRDGDFLQIMNWWDDYRMFHPTVAPYGGEFIYSLYDVNSGERHLYKHTRRTNNSQRIGLSSASATFNDDADWWHPSYFPVEPRASQLTTTWGDLKKKAR